MKIINRIKLFCKKHVSVLIVLVSLLIALTNYLIYPTFISKELNLVDVPIAKDKIKGGTKISNEMLEMISINPDFLPNNIILEKKDIIGKYVQSDYTINNQGFFYQDALTGSEQSWGKTYSQLNEYEVAYVIEFDDKYNSDDLFRVGQYIDLYYYTTIFDQDGIERLMIGKLKDLARVISVNSKDSKNTIISVAITEDEVSYFILAEKTGQILPMVTNNPTCLVYDVDLTRSFLLENGFVLSKIIDIENYEQ